MTTETSHLEADDSEKRDIRGRDGGVEWSPVHVFERPRQNLSAPAFKLPAEVLLEIFLIVRDSSDDKLKEWLQSTHVCNVWRQVALEAHTLWTCLCNTPPGFIPVMLERSKQAPLHISFTQLPSTALLGSILQEIERIQTIVFRNYFSADSLAAIDRVLCSMDRSWEPSILESLTVGDNFLISPRTAMDIFRATDRIRKLTLLSGQYRWSMLPLPNLTELNLMGEPSDAVPGNMLVETLRQMPTLHALGLSLRKLRLPRYRRTPRHQPVHLSFLKKLHVQQGDHYETLSFLALLVLPRLQQLFMDCSESVDPDSNSASESNSDSASDNDSDSDSDFDFDMDVMESFYRHVASAMASGNFSGIKFLTADFESITLSAKPWPPTTLDEPYLRMVVPPNRDSDLVGSVNIFLPALNNILSSINKLNRPDIFRLRHVSIPDDLEKIETYEFGSLFRHLPHVESLEGRSGVIHPLIAFLKEPSRKRRAEIFAPRVSFANLRTIIWRGDGYDCFPPSDSPFSDSEFDKLHSALVLGRRAQNVFVRRLEFLVCDRLNNRQIRKLHDLDVEVVIRGRKYPAAWYW